MGIYEFDQELYDQVLREDGEERGIELGIHIYQAIQSGKKDNSVIAETCGCTPEKVEKVRKKFGI